MRATLALFLALTCTSVSATETTSRSGYDQRIRTVVYNPIDVTPIDAVVGIAVHIVLREGEEYEAHSFGDGGAWSFAHYKNNLFVKPSAENGNTNLTVITNRHTYEFHLHYLADHNSPAAIYQLKFVYPVEIALADAKAATEAAATAKVARDLASTSIAKVNFAYDMSGDRSIAPINVWDDQAFTYFKFPGNVDVPDIFVINADKSESIVNRVSRGAGNDVVVMEKVAAKWVLRLGTLKLGVYNEKYDPIGVTNTSGTSSPIVKRRVRGGQK